MQGNAPLLSVTHGEKETPESCYPLSHIRQDERAGRDSQEAFAQGASSGEGLGAADSPATTTAALLNRSLHTNLARDRIPGPIIRTRHQDAGRRGKIPYNNNRGATRAGPFAPIPLKIGFRVPSFPPVIKIARELPTTEQNCQIYLGRIRARRLQPVHTLSHALGRE